MNRGRHSGGDRLTPFDLAWPDDAEEYANLARDWGGAAFEGMLTAVWNGYDDLAASILDLIDINQADDEIERAITQILEPCIRRHLSGDEPYYVQHGPYELATRRPAPAQSPQYDIAFVLIQNPKVMWPLEAKVLRSDGRVARYVRGIQREFLTGRYAPYVNDGAMLGYLLQGSPVTAFHNISRRLSCPLLSLSPFPSARHQVSVHYRNLANSDFLSGDFRCHHMLMSMYS